MSAKRIFLLGFVLVITVPVLGSAQVATYEDFLRDFLTERGTQLEQDANEFERILDSWSNGKISQSAVVAKLEEMETRADGYFEDVLRLSPPEGKFDRYKQAIYVFVTWSNILGVFTDGMTDLDLAKLDAAGTLSDYFQAKVNSFDEEVLQSSD